MLTHDKRKLVNTSDFYAVVQQKALETLLQDREDLTVGFDRDDSINIPQEDIDAALNKTISYPVLHGIDVNVIQENIMSVTLQDVCMLSDDLESIPEGVLYNEDKFNHGWKEKLLDKIGRAARDEWPDDIQEAINDYLISVIEKVVNDEAESTRFNNVEL